MSSKVELFFRTIIARAYPRVIGTNREKSWIFFDTFLPLLSMAAYVRFLPLVRAPSAGEGDDRHDDALLADGG